MVNKAAGMIMLARIEVSNGDVTSLVPSVCASRASQVLMKS
jgi:hypothetical protein